MSASTNSITTLLEFASEVATSSDRAPVSLGTLQRDGIQFTFAEAISIGQALCLALMTAQRLRRHNADGDAPDAASSVAPVTTETVLIDPASRLGVSVNDPGDEAAVIQSIGEIISEIVPAEARRKLETKVIAKALASPPQFETMADLSQALAAFEQPNGRELIQALYERWKNGDATELSHSRLSARIRLGSHPAVVGAAVFVIALVMFGTSGWFLMTRLDAKDGSPATSTEERTQTSDIGAATPLLPARPIFSLTTGYLTFSVARAEPPTLSHAAVGINRNQAAVAAALPRRAATSRPASAPSPSIARTLSPMADPTLIANGDAAMHVAEASDLTRSDRAVTAMPLPTTEPVRSASIEPVKTPATEPVKNVAFDSARNLAARASQRPANPVIYSSRDANVIPPTPILPRLLASLQPSSPGVRLDALAIAVVVDEQGRAYSVNHVNAPANMGEYVLLTQALVAVKAWEFEPASKDGTPVRYRLILPLRSLTRSAP